MSADVGAAGEAAWPALRRVQRQLELLVPTAAAGEVGGRERERQRQLQRAALHLATQPRARGASAGDDTLREARALRQQAAATLMLLSEHASTEVPQALERALRRWDQAGDLDLLPPRLRAAALALQTRAQAALDGILAARQRDAARLTLLCAAAEASLAVDSACAVLRAVETRFASLLRAQLYRGEAQDEAAQREALLPAGQPFLDLGAALREVAWAFQAGEGSAVGEGAEPAAAAPVEIPLEEAAA